MRKVLVFAILSLGLAAAAAGAREEEPAAFDAARARVYKAAPGRALTTASQAAPASVVARFLESRGVSASAIASLRTVAEKRASRGGITHVRMEQEIAGLRVAGAYVKASLNGRGELIHVIENLAEVPRGGLAPARVNEAEALRAALEVLYPDLESPAQTGRQGNVSAFEQTAFFHSAPRVERVAIAMKGGSLQTGFIVETWSARGNLLHETLVSASGRVLSVELRTNTDSYKIFPEHPDATPQTIVLGPGGGNDASPVGWLAGTQTSINIAGNNAHAYLDTDANNAPDAGGTPVTDENFLTTADLAASPSLAGNRNVAVQNLFYLNNVIHDTLYSSGFDEAAGNFQEDNFGNGARGSDSVNAEAQDGSGTDNANFATPRDGRPPRMQMFLWSGKGDHQVVVDSTATVYPAQGAAFGPALDPTGVPGSIVLADDGNAPLPGGTITDACEAIINDVSNSIALVDRGTCAFTVKVKNAQLAGAVGVIVANNAGDSIFTMGGADATITISSVFIGLTNGNALKGSLPSTGTIRLTDPAPLQRDGDVDSDIVWHEYGHGLTWRMIGRMSGAMSGAVGEGMSDVLSVIVNADDVVGEYSFNDPLGIRTAAYTNYPRTYGDIVGTEVHLDGEVYGAIGWRLFELYGAGNSAELLADLVDGMNFTPAGPAFEDMRDGILQSVAINNPTRECVVWQAFAAYGVGVGAQGRTRGSRVVVTESTTLPSQCIIP